MTFNLPAETPKTPFYHPSESIDQNGHRFRRGKENLNCNRTTGTEPPNWRTCSDLLRMSAKRCDAWRVDRGKQKASTASQASRLFRRRLVRAVEEARAQVHRFTPTDIAAITLKPSLSFNASSIAQMFQRGPIGLNF